MTVVRPCSRSPSESERSLIQSTTQNHFSSLLMVGDGQVKMKAWTRIGVLVNQVREGEPFSGQRGGC